jgi:hypothetical protein
MNSGELMPLPVFWARNGLSKTNYYYLKRMGCGPEVISLGTKDMVSPEAEADWRRSMAKNPVKGSLRSGAFSPRSSAGV